MEHDFDLIINDLSYRVVSPPRERLSKVITLFIVAFFLVLLG